MWIRQWEEIFQKKNPEYASYDQLNDWEFEYIKMSLKEMFSVLVTAELLEIKGLRDLMTKALALQIQGKNTEDIRRTFGIEDPKWNKRELRKIEKDEKKLKRLTDIKTSLEKSAEKNKLRYLMFSE